MGESIGNILLIHSAQNICLQFQNAGIEFGLGNMQWELAGTLFLAWVMVYLIIWKGLHSSGKVKIEVHIFGIRLTT